MKKLIISWGKRTVCVFCLLLVFCLLPAAGVRADSGAGVSVGHADYTDLYRHYPNIFGVTAPGGTNTAPSYLGVGMYAVEHIDGTERYATLNYAWLNSYVNGRFSVNGEIAYCFDLLTSATGTYVRSSSLAEAGIPADSQKVENVLKMATALTANSFAYITSHAEELVRASMPSIAAGTHTNSAGQRYSTAAFTPDRAALVALLSGTNADAQNLKQLLVQCAVWHKMNNIEWMARESSGNVITTTYIDKETGQVTTSTGLAASCIGLGTVIDFDRMYTDGLAYYEAEIAQATQTAWSYVFRIGESKTLTGQEAADVLSCYIRDGYIGRSGDFTVSGDWNALTVTCVRKTQDGWYPTQSSSTSSNTIYSSKPYDMHTGLYQTGGRGSGQFIATAQNLHETEVKVRVENSGQVQLEKVSAKPEITEGNSCYSPEGIRYGIFSDAAASVPAMDKEGAEAILTVQADGSSNVLKMEAGTYYLKEIFVPERCGYHLNDEDTEEFSVEADETAVLHVSDEPLNDPAGIRIVKLNAEGRTVPGEDMSGAEYSVQFYPGQYTEENLPEEPAAAWVIRTLEDENGCFCAVLDEVHMVSGPGAVCGKSADGSFILPLGTLTVTETKAPEGFTAEGSVLYPAGGSPEEGSVRLLINLTDENGTVTAVSGQTAASAEEGIVLEQREQYEPVETSAEETTEEESETAPETAAPPCSTEAETLPPPLTTPPTADSRSLAGWIITAAAAVLGIAGLLAAGRRKE